MKGYLKKWTNYTGGWKLRWFVLEDGVLSYYKHQGNMMRRNSEYNILTLFCTDDIGSACRGVINMRIARLHMDPQDKQRFEILGKSSVKYHLKANHVVEAKRWYWTLNNSIQWAKDEAKEEERRQAAEAERMGRLKEMTIQQQQQLQHQRNTSTAELTERSSSRRAGSNASSAVDVSATGETDSERMQPNRDRLSVQESQGSESDGDDDSDSDSNTRADPPTADALALAANSARLQLDLLAQVCLALQFQREEDPKTTLGDVTVSAALNGYESAVTGLKKLVGDVLKMSKERDRYWKYRIGKEQELRRLWEENMQKLVEEHEALQGKVGEERDKKKKAKRVLKEVLREREYAISEAVSRQVETEDEYQDIVIAPEPKVGAHPKSDFSIMLIVSTENISSPTCS